MKTFIVTLRTASGRQQINVIAACSFDALLPFAELLHGQACTISIRPGVSW